MNHSNLIIYIFEMIGTVAFASSGALVGIRKNIDMFGIMCSASRLPWAADASAISSSASHRKCFRISAMSVLPS